MHSFQSNMSSCYVLFDILKDITFYFIILYHFHKGEAKSEAELLFLNVILFSFSMSHVSMGLFSFFNRCYFLKIKHKSTLERVLFIFMLFLLCPLIPIFIKIKLSSLKKQQERIFYAYNKSEMSLDDCLLQNHCLQQEIDNLVECNADLNIIHVTLESIPQTLFLFCFVSFHFLNFYTNSGRYLYFFSISRSILSTKNWLQTVLFTVPIAISFLKLL